MEHENKKAFLFTGFTYFFLSGCSLLFQIVEIEVPKGYLGWVYVIPVQDTSGVQIRKASGRYQVDEHGIAYVPAFLLDMKKASRVLVYEAGKEISAQSRYAGNVTKVKNGTKKYEYIKFFLPSLEERKIADGTQYWRDKAWEYGEPERSKFDSLLEIGKLKFQ